MDSLPSVETVTVALREHWGVDATVARSPKTKRLFLFERSGERLFARLNWPRGELGAADVVQFVEHLGRNGAPVPRIVPTETGDLCVPVGDSAVLSVETELPGEPCHSENLHLLDEVGRGLAAIHRASEEFAPTAGRRYSLREYADGKLSQALGRSLSPELVAALSNLQEALRTDWAEIAETPLTWITTHGDVCAHNVHGHGNAVGFCDIYCTFAPAAADLVMVNHRWLLDDLRGNGRPLRPEEMKQFLQGYLAERALSQAERGTFGLVWAAYYANKLSFYAEKPDRVKDPHIDRFDFAGQILRLRDSVDEAQALLD